MQSEYLKTFTDLVLTKSFTRAAEQNNISQSAVSQQIRTMEEELDAKLLDRSHRSLRLTPAGEVVHRAAHDVLLRLNKMSEELNALTDTVGGTVRVATITSVGLHEFPERLTTFFRAHPAVTVHVEYLRPSRVIQMVMEEEADLGIVVYPQKRAGLEVHPYGEDRLVLILPPDHPLAREDEKHFSMDRLNGQNFVCFEPLVPTRHATDEALKRHRITIRPVIEVDNVETVKCAVRMGAGLAIVPEPSVRAEVQTGQLKMIPLAGKEFRRPIGIILLKNKTRTPAVEHLLRHLQLSAKG